MYIKWKIVFNSGIWDNTFRLNLLTDLQDPKSTANIIFISSLYKRCSALSLSSLDSIFYLQPQPVMTKVNIMYLLPGLTHNVFYCNVWKLWICFFTFNCNQANHNTLCTWMYLYSLIVWCWKHWCFCWSLAGTRRCVSKLLLWVFTNYIRRITNDWL